VVSFKNRIRKMTGKSQQGIFGEDGNVLFQNLPPDQ
jgi:hypothetical protein